MTLHMIGLGLSDEKDISIKGLETIKKCDYIYLEHYTSIMPFSSIEKMEELYGKNIILASREMVEQRSDDIISKAKDFEVAFLVAGDVFCATTHSDFLLRAKQSGVKTNIINNASIMNAVGNIGFEVYKFGKTTSMVFFEENWMPRNVYDCIKENQSIGAHTLILLDIKIAETARENMLKGIEKKLKPRFMDVNKALKQLLDLEDKYKEKVIDKNTKVIGTARLGTNEQEIAYGTLKKVMKHKFGGPLHSLIIPSKLHFMEEDVLKEFSIE
ncbi:MAG: diphthine synthase [Nanobdellota archaeon]